MSDEFLLFVVVGFAAQIVDGAIGMAYGITAASVLIGFGVPPVTASAAIHAAEVATTAASGAAHWRAGNVQRQLMLRLALPGVVGGVAGAMLLTSISGDHLRPVVAAYLLVMGCVILRRAFHNIETSTQCTGEPALLGLSGGFLDAVGGGGWGAMVATTLIGRGLTPRYAIGTANAAEFFVTSAVTATFVLSIGLTLWPIILGLVIGGVLAAPLAAYLTRRVPEQWLMMIVGIIVIALSLRTLAMTV